MLANDPPVSDCRMLCLKERMLENLSLSLILHSFGTLGSLTNDHRHDLYDLCMVVYLKAQLESLGHDARGGGRS